MKHVQRSLVLCAAVLTLSGGALVGCSSDDEAADKATTTLAPADGAADDGASDDDVAGTEEGGAESVDDICTLLTPEEVGAIVGGTVVAEDVPGGGCSFDQDDPRAASVAFATVVATDDTDGTFNEARVGAFGTLTDPVKEEPGIGDYSAVASGTFGGGESHQGAGIVQVGRTLVQVTVVQGSGLDAAAVRAMTTAALTLAASKL